MDMKTLPVKPQNPNLAVTKDIFVEAGLVGLILGK
jgi:hypothetical protein